MTLKLTQNQKILWLLSDGKEHSPKEFIQMNVYKYTSRISDLREEGHEIVARRVKGSFYKYRLIPKKGQVNLCL